MCYGFGQPFDRNVLAAMAARVSPVWRASGIEPDPYAGIYRGRYLDPRPPGLPAPGTVPAAHGVQPIRPEIPGEPAAVLPPWAQQLGDRPVVYVSLGTAPLFNQPEKFTPLLAGLATQDVDVVVTVRDAALAVLMETSSERSAARQLAAEIAAMPSAALVAVQLQSICTAGSAA